VSAAVGERGSVSVELALLAPALLLLVAFAVLAGRTQIAEGAVQEAARAAAREASLARDAVTAGALAERTLAAQDLRCPNTSVDVDTAGFAAPPGQRGDVTVTVTCVVGMTDLLAPGLPGTVTVEAAFTSPVDAYRER
jgi:Flp pilus assembly protein TadG